MRSDLSDRAYAGAIRNFALNLKPLLMQPPVKGFVTMGLDPVSYTHLDVYKRQRSSSWMNPPPTALLHKLTKSAGIFVIPVLFPVLNLKRRT